MAGKKKLQPVKLTRKAKPPKGKAPVVALAPRKPPPPVPAGADDFVTGGAVTAAASPAAPVERNKGGRPPKPKADENIVQTTVRLPDSLHMAARMACLKNKQTFSELVEALLREKLGA